MTHHGPHPLSIHLRYQEDQINSGFVSDLTPLLYQADLWLHGHEHDSFDYSDVGRCRVVANPAGYLFTWVEHVFSVVKRLWGLPKYATEACKKMPRVPSQRRPWLTVTCVERP